jgi:mono/diheme cytochrome c family protein
MWKTIAFLALFLTFILSLTNCETETYRQGRILYENFCASCHMEDGTGLSGVIPPLAGADYLRDNQKDLPCIIRVGMQGEIVVNGKKYDSVMKGENKLSHFEISNIINYINQAWGNDFGIIKFDDVQEELEKCPKIYQ